MADGINQNRDKLIVTGLENEFRLACYAIADNEHAVNIREPVHRAWLLFKYKVLNSGIQNPLVGRRK